jgi:hypothetical protein
MQTLTEIAVEKAREGIFTRLEAAFGSSAFFHDQCGKLGAN